MDKPLFVECHNALEYNYLFKDVDNMNFYSAKMDENEYIVVDDYDCDNYDIWSEVQNCSFWRMIDCFVDIKENMV